MSGCSSESVAMTLTQEAFPGVHLGEPLDQYTIPQMTGWLLCHGSECHQQENIQDTPQSMPIVLISTNGTQ